MNRQEMMHRILSGKTCTIQFIKRTDGKPRTMNMRTGVKKHLKGIGASYDFKAKGLNSCFLMAGDENYVKDGGYKNYRCFPIEAVYKIDGITVE